MSVVLALGAGAALGWANIGVIRVLEREGVEIAGVAGASMGALVAVAHAGGRLNALEAFGVSLTRRKVIARLSLLGPRGGLLSGRKVARIFEEQIGGLRLEALNMPAAVTAVDLSNGADVHLREGDAVPAALASCAVPGLLPPIRIGGRLLGDGGAYAPVPVGAARGLAARPVIGVSVLGDYARRSRAMGLAHPDAKPGSIAVAAAGFGLIMARLSALTLANDPPDLLIEPKLGAFGPEQFHEAAALIALGAAAAEEQLPAIRALAGR